MVGKANRSVRYRLEWLSVYNFALFGFIVRPIPIGIAVLRASTYVVASLYGSVAVADERMARPNVRDVTPAGITRVYGVPDSETKRAESKRVEERQFENTRVLPDGTIRSKDETIVLYGVALPARDKLCVTTAGARWACGMSAIGALRNMIQGRSITCSVHDNRSNNNAKTTGSCRLGQIDISVRLLEQGWATPDESAQEKRYAEAAEQGRSKRVGLWASGPSPTR